MSKVALFKTVWVLRMYQNINLRNENKPWYINFREIMKMRQKPKSKNSRTGWHRRKCNLLGEIASKSRC